MRARWPLLVTVLTVGFTYVAYPYFTLYRLGNAVQHADTASLETLVDWPAVREGIKEDICDLVTDTPTGDTGNKLPTFGASFIRGIASSSIDKNVTAQGIVSASLASTGPKPAASGGMNFHLGWAFFDSPTAFTANLKANGYDDPIKVEMTLNDGVWQVNRVWLPTEMLTNRQART